MKSKKLNREKIKLLHNHLLLRELFLSVEEYAPEMLDETVSSAEEIGPWLDRFLTKLPPDVRKRFVDD